MPDSSPKPDAVFFASAAEFRAWLEANHDKAKEIWVGLRKKGSGLTGITYKEAVDQGLCFGWIDGVMNRIDGTSHRQRFTPRRKRSIWSAVNIARVDELTRAGLMHPAGLAAYEGRDPSRANLYSFEQGDLALPEAEEAEFRRNETAWAFFQGQPPSYRKQAIWWVISAKKEDTRVCRLGTLIGDSAEGRRLKHLTRPAGKPEA